MNNLIPIREQLDRIEKKLDGKYSDPFLSIKQVKDYTGLSSSTIRRAVHKGYLKPSMRSGKLIFKQSNVDKWLGGK